MTPNFKNCPNCSEIIPVNYLYCIDCYKIKYKERCEVCSNRYLTKNELKSHFLEKITQGCLAHQKFKAKEDQFNQLPFDLQTEQWKDIPGYEGYYQISNYGRVKSLDRTVNRNNGRTLTIPGKIKINKSDQSGYPVIGLSKNNKTTLYKIHRLVLLAFIGPPPQKDYVACHNDDNRENCHLSNLRWDSKKNNALDKKKNRPNWGGENHPPAKLTAQQIIEIRSLYPQLKSPALAKKFNVTKTTIWEILNRKTWKFL